MICGRWCGAPTRCRPRPLRPLFGSRGHRGPAPPPPRRPAGGGQLAAAAWGTRLQRARARGDAEARCRQAGPAAAAGAGDQRRPDQRQAARQRHHLPRRADRAQGVPEDGAVPAQHPPEPPNAGGAPDRRREDAHDHRDAQQALRRSSDQGGGAPDPDAGHAVPGGPARHHDPVAQPVPRLRPPGARPGFRLADAVRWSSDG